MGHDHCRRPEFILAADLVQESFGDKFLIFLPDADIILTVNPSAAELLDQLKRWFARSSFTEDDLAVRIFRNYKLSEAAAAREASMIVKSCVRYGLLERKEPSRRSGPRPGNLSKKLI